jgi:DNA-binding transcriptional regulator LsrR (DeoR family)
MAAERLPMRKLREVIRLKLQVGQSGRAIARVCGLSPSTVGEYVGRIALAGLMQLTIEDARFDFALRDEEITAEAALDGIYVIRTSIASATIFAEPLTAMGV